MPETYNTKTCGSYKILFCTSDCYNIHVRVTGEWGIRKDVEGGHGLFGELFHHISRRNDTATNTLAEDQTRYLRNIFSLHPFQHKKICTL